MTAASFAGLPVFPTARLDILAAEIPTVFHDKELVLDTARCRQLVHQLKREIIIGIAGEGIRVGRDGPLTLFQIGTFYGKVYIFDTLVNSDLIDKGGLRQLLESPDILKVTHTVCHLSAALYYQYAVSLRNVFDTQVGHLIIEQDQGRRLPNRMSMSGVCQKYSETGHPYDWRSDIKEMWVSRIGDYWSQRPLTDEMVEYAAGDVMAVIPDVFRNQLEYIEGHGLMKKFKSLVEEEVLLEINIVVKETRGKRLEQEVKAILREIDEKYDEKAKFFEVSSDDELNALRLVPYDETLTISAKINKFKVELVLEELETLENDLKLNQEMIRARPNLDAELGEYELHPDVQVRIKAKTIRSELYKEIIKTIGNRYSGLVSPDIMSETERQAIRSLTPVSEYDKAYDPTVLAFHWLVFDHDLDKAIFTLQHGLSDQVISEDLVAKANKCVNIAINVVLRQKCHLFLKHWDKVQRNSVGTVKKVTFEKTS